MKALQYRRLALFGLMVAVAGVLLQGCATNGSAGSIVGSPSSPLLDARTTGALRGSTVPYWSSSFTYGGTTYGYQMVGTDPSLGGVTTTIATTIVPIAMTFSNGKTFDGTAGAASAIQSPLFVSSRYPEGTTQFGDAVMRGEFWQYAARESYHVMLAPDIVATQDITVPKADGSVVTIGRQRVGVVTFAWFVKTVEPQIIAQLGLSPTGLTIFVPGDDVRLLEQDGRCCYYGFHASITQRTASGRETLTTVFAPDGGVSVETLSHEIAEWLNDPFDDNVVPRWVNPTTEQCDSDKLEVGDPLVNNGFHQSGYQLQDIAFLSWFSRDTPSIGIGGQYDLRGTLTAPAVDCVKP
jgi:hypothetical protein